MDLKKGLAVMMSVLIGIGTNALPAFAEETAAEEGTETAAEEVIEMPSEERIEIPAEEETWAGETENESKMDASQKRSVEDMVAGMTLDEKIAQMIIPAIRTWNGEDVTDLSAAPGLAEALRKHQYGGIILFAINIRETDQVTRLTADLQANNAAAENVSVHIPYFLPVDEEGGQVIRLSSGTRMNGNMAIGATGEKAAENARTTGRIIGEEIAATGFNVDFAPAVDVNNNAANPVIGTRSFSDDPQFVSELGIAYAEGLSGEGILPTYKHFPGHGDTSVDSHIGTPSVEKTYEELQQVELVPFAAAIENGAEMIMTAHITFPLIDEEVTYGDGVTTGYYPATMSHRIISEILRGDMGFDGLVVTDALEMDAIRTAALVPGEEGSVEYAVNIAEKVINAGVDILLLPKDLTDPDMAEFYDGYIAGIAAKVEDGTIRMERIDESVIRILKCKEAHGILDLDTSEEGLDAAIENAVSVVGCDEHHAAEMEIARQAITVVKNEDQLLPLTDAKKIVFLGRQSDDAMTINYTLDNLRADGQIAETTEIYVDYYYDTTDGSLHYTDEIKEAIAGADAVIVLTKTYNMSTLAEDSAQYQGVHSAIEDAHAAGGKFILLSDNLPYDAARYQEADAIVLAYMAAGLDMDPTERTAGKNNQKAFNTNVAAAVETIFGANEPKGILPVSLPVIETAEDGTISYGEDILYERGYGLK